MKTTDVPFLKESPMADTKPTTTPAKSEDKPAAKPVAVSLAPAGESADPAVHKLLADRQAAVMNVEAAEPKVDEEKVRAAKDVVAAIDDELAKLGVTAK